jgi:hypothetical protein
VGWRAFGTFQHESLHEALKASEGLVLLSILEQNNHLSVSYLLIIKRISEYIVLKNASSLHSFSKIEAFFNLKLTKKFIYTFYNFSIFVKTTDYESSDRSRQPV